MQTMEYYSATKRNEPEDTKRDGGFNHVTFQKRQTDRESKDQWFLGVHVKGGRNWKSTEDF